MLSVSEYPVIWITIIAAAIFALVGFGWLVMSTASKLTFKERRLAIRLRYALLLWSLVAVAYAATVGLDFRTFAPMLLMPLLIGIVVMFREPASNILQTISLPLLVGLGTYRVAGFIFLYSHFELDLLSPGFAFNAGWGDVLTGVLAPFVALLALKSHPLTFTAICIWTLIGVGELILAPISAGLYGAEELTMIPLSLIPLFLGPPFGILLHVVTLRAAWLQLGKPSLCAIFLRKNPESLRSHPGTTQR